MARAGLLWLLGIPICCSCGLSVGCIRRSTPTFNIDCKSSE
jgi:hypothetical protein